jgi:hypothetical protein
MSPSGLVIMRLVKLAPGPLVAVATTLPATSSTLATDVVSDPLLLVALEPEPATAVCNGAVGSRPRYSRIRTSGYTAAALKRTVTVLPAPPVMFFA